MTRTLFLALAALLGGLGSAGATDTASPDAAALWLADPTRVFDAAEVDLTDFLWIARPIVVFADTPADPRFREQVDLLAARPEELARRDVVVVLDATPSARTSAREKLRPRGFMVALIGKDGSVSLRKPFPWDVREFSRSIDKMPMRQEELRRERDVGG